MKKILLLALLLVGSHANAAIFGQIPTLTVGGLLFTNPTALKVLYSRASSGTRTTARLPSGTAGYQVPAGKTYSLYALRCTSYGTNDGFSLLYADNDVGLRSGTAFTNPVYFVGDSGAAFNGGAAGVTQEWSFYGSPFVVPANKYPGHTNDAGVACWWYGLEQ